MFHPSNSVTLIEVGPRDGLQNITHAILSPEAKARYIQTLIDAGLKNIEIGSFVSKKIVQMQNTGQVLQLLKKPKDVNFIALVGNEKYALEAIENGVDELAVFTTVSESFSMKNNGCSINESIIQIHKVITLAKQYKVKIRGYISCVFGCPYEGCRDVYLSRAVGIAVCLTKLGCHTISFADTIGCATPQKLIHLLTSYMLKSYVLLSNIALHFHVKDHNEHVDELIKIALDHNIRRFDCSSGGLGGCPNAPGAPGNISTENLIRILEQNNFLHGINKNILSSATEYIRKEIDKNVLRARL